MIGKAKAALEEFRGANAVFQLLEVFHPNRSLAVESFAEAFALLREIGAMYRIGEPLVPPELEERVLRAPEKEDVTAIWRALQDKLFSGVLPEGPPPEPPPIESAELLAAIDGSPDDPAPYLVYADWLQQQGDARGQLIALDHAMIERDDAALEAEVVKLLNRHPSLLPSIAQCSRFCGFVRKASVSHCRTKDLIELFAHPSMRFVREVTIAQIDALGPLALPKHVESLVLRTSGDVGQLAMTPRLKRLRISGGTWSLSSFRPADLEELELIGVERAILETEIAPPRLRSLVIDQYRGRLAAVEQILAARNLPRLEHLGLVGLRMPKTACRMLSRCDLLPQLVSLDLSRTSLSDAGVRELLNSRALSRLARLDVSGSEVSEAGAELLRSGLAAEVVS